MASDESYMDFLNKANEDPSAGRANNAETTSSDFRSTESGTETPAVLVKATKDAFYMSEADEPFVPVALGWQKGLPNEGAFRCCFSGVGLLCIASQPIDVITWLTRACVFLCECFKGLSC